MAKKKKKPNPPPPPVRNKPPRASAATAGPTRRELERTAAVQAASRARTRGALVTAGVALVAVAAIAGFVVLDQRRDGELRTALTSGSCMVDTETDPTNAPPGNHVQRPSYEVNPPAGGNHLGSQVTRSGVYAGTAVPPDGALVHALEHGYVIVWHDGNRSPEELERLETFQRENDGDVIVAERPALPAPVAATAWEQRLLCSAVEPDALERFADTYIGKGPEDVARG